MHVCALSLVGCLRPHDLPFEIDPRLCFSVVVSTVRLERIKRLKLSRGVDLNYFPTLVLQAGCEQEEILKS